VFFIQVNNSLTVNHNRAVDTTAIFDENSTIMVPGGEWSNVIIVVTPSAIKAYINGDLTGSNKGTFTYGDSNTWNWGFSDNKGGVISNNSPSGTLKVANVYYCIGTAFTPAQIKIFSVNPGTQGRLKPVIEIAKPPPSPPPASGKTGTIIIIVVVILLLLGGGAAFIMVSKKKSVPGASFGKRIAQFGRDLKKLH